MTALRHHLMAAAATAAATMASLAAVPAHAQGTGVQVLVEQAGYWRAQGQPARAAAALERALASQPSNPDVLAAAALTQSELGQPGAAQDLLQRLRQVAPDDARVAKVEAALKAAAEQVAPAAAAQARQDGQEALEGGDPARAARAFEAAMARDPRDAGALGGLGLIRLRQGRAEEASALLGRAAAVSAEQARRWAAPLTEAAFAAELTTARRLLGRGDTGGAEALLLRASRREAMDRAEADALLGEIALRAGDLDEAEARFRSAQLRRPALPAARDGLLETLRRANRIAEADALARQAGAGSARAEALRAEAARTEDPEAAILLLRKAVEASPAPWPKLDLARLLARQGRGAEGRALLEGGLPASPAPDAVLAAALFASDEGRFADGIRLLDRVPDRVRGVIGARLLRTLRWQVEVGSALGQDPAGMRAALLSMAGRPDPTGEGALLALRGLLRAGDRDGAAEATRLALAANRGGTPAARIALAGAMVDAGLAREGADLLKPLAAEVGLPAAQRRQVVALGGAAAPTAVAAAAPAAPIQADPPQIYQGARDPRVAGRIAEAVLRRDPRNVEARLGATEAALLRRDVDAAEALVAEGRFLNASDPRISVAEAQLARATGDRRRAQTALQLAADQRRAQLGTAAAPYRRTVLAGSAADGRGSSSVALDASPAGAAQVGVTPSQLRESDDPLLSEIGRQLAEVNEEASGRVVPNLAFRARSGNTGLERLREYGGGVEAAAPLPSIGGELSARVQAVTISSGKLGDAPEDLRRFGTNPVVLPGLGTEIPGDQIARARSRDSSATGTSLGIAYARSGVTVDVGSTPLGFRETTVLGGVELTPRLGENLQLRLRGERRSVTDSVLSWAGARDPQSGVTFGGVTRNTGIVQLEYYPGRFGGYVGGGYSYITGNNVADNQRWQAQGGASYAILRNPQHELVAGLDLAYYHYEKNLRYFTLGQGGYFSPQHYLAATIPVDWRQRLGNFSYRVGASIGLGYFQEKNTAIFPDNQNLQELLVGQAQSDPSITTRYGGQHRVSLLGGARLDLEYALTPTLRVGASARYDKSADYEETRALVYARYRFDP